MNISQAKQIPLSVIVEALGGKYSHSHRNSKEHWYFSPFRPSERTASFKVDERTNKWHDFGLAGAKQGNGGDAVDLWCDFHNLDRKNGVKTALDGLRPFGNSMTSSHDKTFTMLRNTAASNAVEITTDRPRFEIIKLHKKIFFPQIIAEVQRRKISLPLANLYLKQVYLKDIEDPNRHMNGLAFENMKGGFEISIPNTVTGKAFKTSTKPKAPSLIKGEDNSGIEIFEGFWDFLSLLEMQKRTVPLYDSYVLNSVSFAGYVINEIKQFGANIKSVLLYLDNDTTGRHTTYNIIQELEPLISIIGTKEHVYRGYKDLNEMLVNS